MAAKVAAKFKYSDGKKMTRHPGSGTFNVRLPYALTVPPHGSTLVKFGVSCESHPIHTFPVRGLKAMGLVVDVSQPMMFDAGEELAVLLQNQGAGMIPLEEGETVLRAAVMDCSSVVDADEAKKKE